MKLLSGRLLSVLIFPMLLTVFAAIIQVSFDLVMILIVYLKIVDGEIATRIGRYLSLISLGCGLGFTIYIYKNYVRGKKIFDEI